MGDKPSIGIVLSGGAARGLLHIGVLKALEVYDISPTHISGSSMGAIVGALYAAGISPEEMLEIASTKSFINFFNFHWKGGGILQHRFLEKLLKEKIPHNTFSQLAKKLYICTTNLSKECYEVFSEGEICKPVIASASIPVLFKPVKIHTDYHVDGGLLNNLPAQPLNDCNVLIGVNAVNYSGQMTYLHTRTVLAQVFNLVIKQNMQPNLKKCDEIIAPTFEKINDLMDFSKAKELYEIGYKEGKRLAMALNAKK
ncbi:patatin-like phospholipase family protein [Rapidithrix thailandica]|uniref:Patatin-like phospholipase family protein n=1 Tax=Rapidithrix thailandica TaxID=413964 RepID=A0AAW9RRH3_9BACT